MTDAKIASRYAHALFDSALERGYIDRADEQLGALQGALEKDRSLVEYLLAPQVPDDKKEELIHNLFDSLFDKPVVEFLILLARKRRIGALLEILKNFRLRVSDYRGVVKAVATSAFPIDAAQREKLIAELKSKTGKQVELVETLDKRVVGGLSVRIKDTVYDGTVRHYLQGLREKLEALEV